MACVWEFDVGGGHVPVSMASRGRSRISSHTYGCVANAFLAKYEEFDEVFVCEFG